MDVHHPTGVVWVLLVFSLLSFGLLNNEKTFVVSPGSSKEVLRKILSNASVSRGAVFHVIGAAASRQIALRLREVTMATVAGHTLVSHHAGLRPKR